MGGNERDVHAKETFPNFAKLLWINTLDTNMLMTPRRIVMQGVKEALPALLAAFQELDADNSGCLTREDCEKMFDWRKRPET